MLVADGGIITSRLIFGSAFIPVSGCTTST
jgi:hypothetical protein